MEKLVILVIVFAVSQLVKLFSNAAKADPTPTRQVGPPNAGRPRNPQSQPQPQKHREAATPPKTQRRNQRNPQTSQPRRQTAISDNNTSSKSSASPLSDLVNTHLQPRVAAAVKQHFDQHVQEHLGSNHLASTNAPDLSPPTASAAIRNLLQSPSGVRQAVLINEILDRPRILRR